MTTVKILNEEPITMAEVKEELAKIKKRDKELGFRANKNEEYLNQFVKVKNAGDLVKKIDKLGIPRLKTNHIVKIVDVMPKTVNDLKVLLQGFTITVNNENLTKIVEVLEKAG